MNPILEGLMDEVTNQDHRHPDGYPLTRDGIRLGIASLDDETQEVWERWRDMKRRLFDGTSTKLELSFLREEILQVMAIGYRMVRSIDNAS